MPPMLFLLFAYADIIIVAGVAIVMAKISIILLVFLKGPKMAHNFIISFFSFDTKIRWGGFFIILTQKVSQLSLIHI